MNFKQIPLLLPFSSLISGIIMSSYISGSIPVSTIHVSMAALGILILNSLVPVGILLRIIPFILLGVAISNPGNNSNIETELVLSDSLFIQISDVGITSSGRPKLISQVKFINENSQSQLNDFSVVIYTENDLEFKPFQIYKIPNKLKPIKTFRNPHKFDYGSWLKKKGITHTCFLNANELVFICQKTPLIYQLRKLKLKGANVFRENLNTDEHAQLINTLIFGEKRGLDRQTKSLFINNGLAHLLAISGMHVGIIFLILSFFLQYLAPAPFRNLLIISGIWFFIVLSGMQIPAVRAGIMFSALAFGKSLSRNTNSLNSIPNF